LVKTKPQWVWARCKRQIRPPQLIYPLIEELFHTYGPLLDANTKQPLFNRNAWKAAQGVLRTIRDGFVSDPPGVALYFQIGIDAKANDLPIYFCCRGTNISEGAVHRPILHVFPSAGVGVRHAIMSLGAFILRHNLTVGTRNRTGHAYKGHFNIALMNKLHYLLHMTQYLIPEQDTMSGWINGSLYEPTPERIGIAPVPDRLLQSTDMLPFDPSMEPQISHSFLAKSQGTQYAVTPICTAPEKKKFGELKRTIPSYRNNDHIAAARLWNQKFADGTNYFYKVSE
jgi:hypothetical protein